MIRCLWQWTFAILFFTVPAIAGEILHHRLQVTIEPRQKSIDVEDTITWRNEGQKPFIFVLYKPLSITRIQQGWKLETLKETSQDSVGINAYFKDTSKYWPLQLYRLTPPRNLSIGKVDVEIRYGGPIAYSPKAQGEEYVRSFRETPGIVSEEGVYLSSSSFWYPRGDETMTTFQLSVSVPIGWQVISQGKQNEAFSLAVENGASKPKVKTRQIVSWDCPVAMEEIYLVGGPLHLYKLRHGKIDTLVYLRQSDDALAKKYQDATVEYLLLYQKLLGPYPYSKFALVENFWETGYGMPSFTLLGSQIIRFPFILRSSYPHEILHNWWGNGVFVDYDKGNWCEGLTAYMADHLMKEIQGQGAEYRRGVLQKYRNFVRSGQDFPLVQFRSRHSAATEAVGYGKALMMFHELRQNLGDEAFIAGLQQFYRQFRFRKASFVDIADVFSAVAKRDLHPFFSDRTERTGAPQLEISAVKALPQGVQFTLRQQTAGSPPYQLRVPIAITVEGRDEAVWKYLALDKSSQDFTIELPTKPLRIDVDPQFDLFRKLDRREIPSSLGQIFGAAKTLIVYATGPVEEKYRALARSWSHGQEHRIKIIADRELVKLPADCAIWFIGPVQSKALHLPKCFNEYGVVFSTDSVSWQGRKFTTADHAVVLTTRHPDNPDLAIGWVVGGPADAVPNLARKLPHYRKYSYLTFQGAAAQNVDKGQWPVLGSPMTISLQSQLPPMGKSQPRKPLAELPSPVDEDSLRRHVAHLAAAEMRGRGLATPELDKAARYISDAFRKAGLQPGRKGSYYDTWQTTVQGLSDATVALQNVVAIIPGQDQNLSQAPVVIGAHYDHLGTGWPDAKAGNSGKIHPGADDNASGVAVLLELARLLVDSNPRRDIIFVAFTGEEAGRIGSRHFVEVLQNEGKKPLAMINLDSVGRLGERKLRILGTGSAYQWAFIFHGYASILNIGVSPVPDSPDSSDHTSFLEKDIPAVHIFSGVHLDYHTPEDTIDKVDFTGMAKITTLLKEVLLYTANREKPFTKGATPRETTTSNKNEKRRASLGTIPDFSHHAKGVLLSGVVPASPAAKAGLKKGDILVGIGKFDIANLRQMADALRHYKPGDNVEVRYQRESKLHKVAVTLAKR